jgi:hypothetical protein
MGLETENTTPMRHDIELGTVVVSAPLKSKCIRGDEHTLSFAFEEIPLLFPLRLKFHLSAILTIHRNHRWFLRKAADSPFPSFSRPLQPRSSRQLWLTVGNPLCILGRSRFGGDEAAAMQTRRK